MKRLWRTLEAIAWVVFFTLAAAALGLRYGVLPQIERYRPEIVARVAATVGLPVKIGRIEAEWLGLRPQINLTDVRIYDAEGREALVLPSVENILSWRSLAHGELRLHALRIERPRLAVRRDASGTVYIAGLRLAPSASDEGGFTRWLLAQREIEVRDAEVEWRDEQRAAPPLVLSALSLRLRNESQAHALGLTARPPVLLGSSLELRAELAGEDLDDPLAWSGRVYAELGYTDLAAWRQWIDYPADVLGGQGALRVWSDVRRGKLVELRADLALSEVAAKLAADLPPLEVASVTGRVQIRALQEGRALEVRRLSLTPRGGAPLQPLDFQLAWNAAGEAGMVGARSLELAPLARFAEALPLPPELRRLALETQPRGSLQDLRFEWRGAIGSPEQYRLRAAFADLGLSPRAAVPGFSRLAGTVDASESGGRLELQSRGAELELPRVFPEPRMVLDTLNGQLAWRREGESLVIEMPSLSFANADLSGNAFGTYIYGGEGPGEIDLSAVFNRADAKHLPHYLPLGALMGEKPREWLVAAILAGEATEAQLRLKGDLRRFPFADPAQGEFRVAARVHKGELLYAKDWPRIEDIEADLLFEGDRMEISGRSGSILGARVHDVRVSIAGIGRPGAHVLVEGQAKGSTAQFLKFVASSPLRKTAGSFVEEIRASGDGQLRLKLDLPLAELRSSRVAGEYELEGNELVLPAPLQTVQRASGTVAFTESSFTLRELRGSTFGGAVMVNGGTKRGGGMEFVARGDAQPGALGELLDHPLRRYLSGSAAYVATVTVREGLQRVVVESSLRGVASALPPPLQKAAAETMPLRVDFGPSEAGSRERIAVSLARVLAAEVQRSREGEAMKLQRAAFWLTPAPGQALSLPEHRGVLVYGSLPALDVDRWRTLQGLQSVEGASLPVSIELKVARVDAYRRRVHNLALRARTDAEGWSAVVDADEIAGQLSYRSKGDGQLVARLLHLTVPPTDAQSGSAVSVKPSELPAVDFVAEQFSARGKEFGRVELSAQRDGTDWRIDKLAVANPSATLRGSGRWRDGGAPGTEVAFTVNATDAGNLLERLGYAGMVAGGRAQLDGTLRWQGEPTAFDYASLSGDLKLSAEDGEFLEIEPGIGKLISLMNLQALPRRIALDFRDVFSKGFRFDRIDAASGLDRGVMQLRQFRMRGPAAEVTMSGQVDVAHETQNLRVRVVPSLGASASTVVGIVNPVVGVAAALAQKVLKDPLGQIFAHEFEVTGGWSDPKVAKLTVVPAPNEGVNP